MNGKEHNKSNKAAAGNLTVTYFPACPKVINDFTAQAFRLTASADHGNDGCSGFTPDFPDSGKKIQFIMIINEFPDFVKSLRDYIFLP
ncbi:MAG: hypothetical protein IJL26_03585 [Clostridia bacterium]|nr:hypothetical protein [Clostridia bacterium]